MSDLSSLLVPRTPTTGRPSPTDDSYAAWAKDPTPERLKAVLDDLDPTISAEVQRFSGPKPLLKSKARALAVKAIRSFDPAGGTRLRSWVVTQLQPLSRYNNSLKPIYVPEEGSRKAYAVAQARERFVDETGRDPSDEELADRVGISVKRLNAVRKAVPATVNEPQAEDGDDDTAPEYAVYRSDELRAASEAVYESLSDRDKLLFDLRTGLHGQTAASGLEIAKRLGVSPALVTQRANAIAQRILEENRRLGA